MYSFLERGWSNSWKRLKVGKISGSYFKRATDTFVLVYSQLDQNELILFHVEKNGGLDGGLDTLYTRGI